MKTRMTATVLLLCILTAAHAGGVFRPPRAAAPADEVLSRADALARAGRVADAEALLRASYGDAEAGVTRFGIAERLAAIALDDGRLDACAHWLDEACRHGLPVHSWHTTRARLDFRRGDEAACLERLEGLHRQTALTALYRGFAAMRLGRRDEALAALREAGPGESLDSRRRLALVSARTVLSRREHERAQAWQPVYRALLTGENPAALDDGVLAEMMAHIAAASAPSAQDPLIALSSPAP